MRGFLSTLLFSLIVNTGVAQDWGNMAAISSTLGSNTGRLYIGDHAPGHIGCPT
ncbi:hypothetical protein [Bradyrhizobium elkanii]|uniref:hypothetical protein n=1 Tax=Bradyrhizobium elkanii TaxID=29448 RepID=UPI001BAD9300|nr:hypothetical protein [Bradyrhizobium elkanii]MBR1164630.1 hypothetical protein [Bradyrhizobium elkanii]